MTETPDHIERQVEENRARVESTLDALKERMSVTQIVDDLGQFVSVEDVRGVMQSAGRQMRENPVALGMIGLGLAWLAFGGTARARRGSGFGDPHRADAADRQHSHDHPRRPPVGRRGGDPAQDRAGMATGHDDAAGGTIPAALDDRQDAAAHPGEDLAPRIGRFRRSPPERAGHWRDDLASRAGHITGRPGDRADNWNDDRHDDRASGWASERVSGWADGRAGHWRDRASRGAHHLRETLSDRMEQQPLLIGAAAVAVGAVIGAALPHTRTEDRWVGPTRDQVWHKAKAGSARLRDRTMQAARETRDAAVEAARDEGLAPAQGETLAAKLGRIAGAAASEARSQIEPVLRAGEDAAPVTASSSAVAEAPAGGAGIAPTGPGSTGHGSTGPGNTGMGETGMAPPIPGASPAGGESPASGAGAARKPGQTR